MRLRLPQVFVLLTFSTVGLSQSSKDEVWKETPDQLRAWAKAAQTKDKDQSHILLHEMQLDLDQEGRLHRTTHRVVEVRDERDVQRWSSLSISWKKTFEARPDIRVRVILPDGEVRNLDPATIVEAPAGEVDPGVFSDAIVLKALPPGLSKGSVLDLVVKEHETKTPFQSGRYDQSALRSFLPMDRLNVTLSWHPSQNLRYKIPESLRLQKTESKNAAGWNTVTLKGEQLDAESPPEALSPYDQTRHAVLEISTASTWAAAGAEYQKIVDEQSGKGKKIPALLKKLKQGQKTNADVIGAITAYVQKDIRYTSLAFGEASVVPRSPDETLERGYGDCKDKATLALALLKEAGIKSRIALLHTAPHAVESDDMVGLDRFNHAILAVEQGKGWTFIDLTAEFFKPGLLPPGVAGQKILLAGPEGKELIPTPTTKAADNQITVSKSFTLSRLGPAKLVRTETASGVFDAFYRRSLAASNPKDLIKDFENAIDPEAEIVSANNVDPKDFGQPFRLEGHFAKSGVVDVWPAGAQVFAFPHQMFSGLPSSLDPLNERDVRGKIQGLKKLLEAREQPLTISFPFQRHAVYQFRLPPHLEITSQPEPTKVDMGAASLTLKSGNCGPSCLELRYTFSTGDNPVWTADEARAFVSSLPRVLDDKLYTVAVKPKAFGLSDAGKFKEAVQYAQKAVQGKDVQAADQLTLAQLLGRLGLTDEAQQLARDAAKAQPQEKRILLHAAELLIRGENQKDCSKGSACPEARKLYEQALKVDSTDRVALRTVPLLTVYNNKGFRYGRGADLQKADAAFAKAMKSPLAEDQEFFNTYLQHLTVTGQWIALDQALRRPPESMPPPVVAAWQVITQIGNEHLDEAKKALDELVAKPDGQASMQGLIKEMMQDRRYKEGAELFRMLKDKLPDSKGTAEAMAAMQPCPEESTPDPKLAISLRHYICTMLSPDSTLDEGMRFIPAFVHDHPDYRKYFATIEWERRLDNSRADPSLPPYFVIDSASTAYEVEEVRKLQQGTLIVLHNTKVFAASPFAASAAERGAEPRLIAVQDKDGYRFIPLDAPSALSLLWFQAHENGQDKAAQDYATLLGEMLDRSVETSKEDKKPGSDTLHYRNIVQQFRPLLKGTVAEQEIVAAVYAPGIYSEKAVAIFSRELQKKTLKPEQLELLDIIGTGRLVALKAYREAAQRLMARSEKGTFTWPMVQSFLELARAGALRQEDFKPLLERLDQSTFEEKLSLSAEIRHLAGDQKGAEKVYQQWLEHPSPNGLTENNAAWFYFTTGRTDEKALQLAQTATESAKQSVANLNTLASIQAELGLTGDAIATQMQYRTLLGDRDLGAADDLVTAINAEKVGLQDAALKRLKKIEVEPETADLKQLLHAKIQLLEKSPKAR